MKRGIVKWFDDHKGYGFIAPEGEEGNDIFVHANGLIDTIKTDDEVEYEVGEHDGKDTAIEVVLLKTT